MHGHVKVEFVNL